ncbi:MAG: hydrogenase maturation nickel metallochaperone HypA [Lachnospiraceae bacterium]|nr:hydrogenase maturation nickel metallochaperone HypA [Lachnospiraceae bacterium]
MRMTCMHCGKEFEVLHRNTECPHCGRRLTVSSDTEINAGKVLNFVTDKERILGYLKTGIGIIAGCLLLILMFREPECNMTVKILTVVFLVAATFLGRKLRHRFPSVPPFWIYYATDIVVLYAFIHIWILLGLDYEAVRFIFGSTLIGRFFFLSVLCIGPAMISARL